MKRSCARVFAAFLPSGPVILAGRGSYDGRGLFRRLSAWGAFREPEGFVMIGGLPGCLRGGPA